MKTSKMTKDECIAFLSENYGFRGINGYGLCRSIENRNNIKLLRLECKIQNQYNLKN